MIVVGVVIGFVVACSLLLGGARLVLSTFFDEEDFDQPRPPRVHGRGKGRRARRRGLRRAGMHASRERGGMKFSGRK